MDYVHLEEIFKKLGDRQEFCTSNFFKDVSKVNYIIIHITLLEQIVNENIDILVKETYLQQKGN